MVHSLSVCTVCGCSVGSVFFRNGLGEIVCSNHRRVIGCTACGSVNDISNEGYIPLCRNCNTDRIRSASDQQAAQQSVLRWFASELGPHKLDEIAVLIGKVSESAVRQGSYGLAMMASYGRQGSAEIHIASGLHSVLYQSVLAHEYMHTLLFMNPRNFIIHETPRLDIVVEEGACQMASYLYLQSVPGSQSLHIRQSIESDPSPVYGDGFRHMRKHFAGFGNFQMFLNDLTSQTQHPEIPLDSSAGREDEFTQEVEKVAERHRPTLLIPAAQKSVPKPLQPSTGKGRQARPIIRLPNIPLSASEPLTKPKKTRPTIILRPK